MIYRSMVKKISINVILYLIVLTIKLSSVTVSFSSTADTLAFQKEINEFGSSPPMKHAIWGFCAIDVATKQIFISHNDDVSLIPASTIKPFISSAALSFLGSDHRFSTEIAIGGDIHNKGVLNGNIYIIGGGDPTLGSSRFGDEVSIDTLFNLVYKALRSLGVREVLGSVIADADCFESIPVPPEWQYEDIGNYYGAPSQGISAHENRVRFVFAPGLRPGMPAELIMTEPEIPWVEIVNEVTTGRRGTGDRVYIYGAPLSNQRWLTGTVPAGVNEFSVFGSNPDPPYYMAFKLTNYLSEMGINVVSQPKTALRMKWMGEDDTLKRKSIVFYQSPKLEEIVYYLNLRSINMYSEAIIKAMGLKFSGEGTTKAGIDAVEHFWKIRGLDLSGMNIRDGSGLGRKSIITTYILAQSLAIFADDENFEIFYGSFPVAGESGSVRNRFRRSSAAGNLRSKSGTLAVVKGFSGYVTTKSGRELAYSLLINHYSGTHAELMMEIEKLLIALCEIDQ